jgi:hypothetical protein
MGLILIPLSALFSQQPQKTANVSAKSMRGSYMMLKQTIDSGLGVQPMVNQQWKIFTDKYVMYAHRISETDSSAGFGIGTYSVENGKVIENMFYGQSGPVNGRYEVSIKPAGDGFTQVVDIPDGNKHYILTEVYKKSDRKITSPLDGAWHMEKRLLIDKNGKADTIQSADSARQFKIYNSGHFMWAASWNDGNSGKRASNYGYGTFDVSAPDQIIETNISSTYVHNLVGKPVKVNFKRTGPDSYEQTIDYPDGSRQVEYYTRLK